MPLVKPIGLIKKTMSKKNRADREKKEKAVTPKTLLEKEPPRELADHPGAREIWRRTVTLYLGLEVQIASSLDRDLLVDYCLAQEEIVQFSADLREARESLQTLRKRVRRVGIRASDELLSEMNEATAQFNALNMRIDRKRKMVMAMRSHLYLTPKARAGVTPGTKQPDPEPDDMDKVLDGDD